MNQLVVLTILTIGVLSLVPVAFGEYYYHEYPSWSIEYPDGWQVMELDTADAVFFMDGSEVGTFGEFGLWKNSYSVWYVPDVGEKLSDTQERKYQIQDNRKICDEATVRADTFTCYNFRVFHEIEPTLTLDGYPIITTVFKYTKDYAQIEGSDYGAGEKNMVSTSSYIYVDNDLWEFWTEHDVGEFDNNKGKLFDTLNSLRIPAVPAAQAIPQIGSSDGGGCLIATAAFGSEMAPQVQFLREIRDNTVMNTQSGATFMTGFNQFYYSFSPQIADYERENPVFKEMVKVSLTPLLTSLTLLNYVEIDSEEEMLGYGIGIILLNIGMYFVAPAVLIISLKKRLDSFRGQ